MKLNHASTVDVSPDVVWILAVGSDARPGEDMTHVRGDALQLIGIDTKTGAAAAIGVPRDSYVDIPGVGHDKINAALYYGGPELLGETVGNLIGIQPDYVFVTRFEKFRAMIGTIGGIEVDNPIAFGDYYAQAGAASRPARSTSARGTRSFFARIRHDLLRGDFDRSANQQRVLQRHPGQDPRERASHHGFIEKGVLSAMENMDTNASPSELYRLARAAAADQAVADHPLRPPGRDRRHRRRQRRAALRRPGPGDGRRGPRRRHARGLPLIVYPRELRRAVRARHLAALAGAWLAALASARSPRPGGRSRGARASPAKTGSLRSRPVACARRRVCSKSAVWHHTGR